MPQLKKEKKKIKEKKMKETNMTHKNEHSSNLSRVSPKGSQRKIEFEHSIPHVRSVTGSRPLALRLRRDCLCER